MKKLILAASMVLVLFGCSQQKQEPVVKNIAPQSGYQCARDHLKTKKEQRAYDSIVNSLLKLEDKVTIKDVSTSEIENVIHAIDTDHPELYYLGDEYEFETDREFQNITYFYPKYRIQKDTIKEYNKTIEDLTKPVIKKAKSLSSDYEKAKYLYDYVLDRSTYAEDSRENQNILSVFLYKETVCAGYSRSLQYLLNKVDIPCTYITGYSKESKTLDEGHAWNMLKLDGNYYYMDATNGDSYKDKEARYIYFAMTDQQMDNINRPDNRDFYEKSKSTKDTYFVKNGAYFNTVDQSKMNRLINKNLKNKSPFSLIYQVKDKNIAARIDKMLTKDDNYIFDATGIYSFDYYIIENTNVYVYVPAGNKIYLED